MPDPTAATAGAQVVDGFGLDLLRANLGITKGNLALSPWSIATALTMTRVGARGTTATEMDKVLHVTDPATVDTAMNALDQLLAGRNGTFGLVDPRKIVELSAADRVFAQSGYRFNPAFLDTLATQYGAAAGIVDYKTATEKARRAINSWVADQTRERITELLKSGVLNDRTRLVLVNAVYLRADWSIPFVPGSTSDLVFHSPASDVTVPFMARTELSPFASGDGWKAVDLDYAGGSLTMTVLVPDAGRFDEIAGHLDTALLARVTATEVLPVDLRLPKFNVASALSLKEQLTALGMPTAFSDSADFSGMSTEGPLKIADVVHQANISVDEMGTVASAATGVIAEATGGVAQVDLVVDRPFIFLLRDKPSGAILFAGQITNPAASS